MPQQDSDKVPMAFHDFLAFFSEEEWKLSHKWQKELYKNVMKEIHRALISLGCTIHGTLLRMNGEAEMNIEDLQCSERADSCDPSSNPAVNPGMLFRIKQEDDNDFEDQYESEEMEMIAVGSPEGDSDVVFSTEEVEQRHLKGLQGDSSSEDDDHSPDPAIIHPVVQTDIKEEEPSPVDHRDCESSKFLNRPIGAEQSMKKKIFEKSYDKAMQCRSTMGHDEAAKLHAFVDRTPFMNPMLQEQEQQLRIEETTQQQSDSNVPTYPNLHQRTPYARRPGSYIGSECILRKGNISAESDTLQGRIPYTYPESKQDFNVNDHSSGFKGKPTEKGRFPCPGCDKSFSAMSRLRQHERTHTGERPYHCTICGKSFNQKGVLGRHQKIHTGEKPFQCNICGKNFNQKNILIKHQQIHTGERPYQCSVCGKSFNQKGTLNRHETIHMKQRTTSESSVDLILIP